MSDDNSNRGAQDRAQMSAEPYKLEYFAYEHCLLKQARATPKPGRSREACV